MFELLLFFFVIRYDYFALFSHSFTTLWVSFQNIKCDFCFISLHMDKLNIYHVHVSCLSNCSLGTLIYKSSLQFTFKEWLKKAAHSTAAVHTKKKYRTWVVHKKASLKLFFSSPRYGYLTLLLCMVAIWTSCFM